MKFRKRIKYCIGEGAIVERLLDKKVQKPSRQVKYLLDSPLLGTLPHKKNYDVLLDDLAHNVGISIIGTMFWYHGGGSIDTTLERINNELPVLMAHGELPALQETLRRYHQKSNEPIPTTLKTHREYNKTDIIRIKGRTLTDDEDDSFIGQYGRPIASEADLVQAGFINTAPGDIVRDARLYSLMRDWVHGREVNQAINDEQNSEPVKVVYDVLSRHRLRAPYEAAKLL